MTSQKSSVKTFSNTFWYTVKNCLYVPAIVASVLIIVLAYITSLNFFTDGYVIDHFFEEKSVASEVKFILLDSGYNAEQELFVLHVIFALAAVILAVMIFKFINSKKTVNVWFGLGISKSKLFYAKLLGGVFLLGAMILLPAVLDLIVNIRLFGFSYELFMSWLYLTGGFIVYTLNIFLLFITVMCVAGTNVEGAVFGGILLFTPSLVYLEISEIMNTLTLGSEFSGSGDLFIRLIYYNPISFMANSTDFSSLMKSTENASFVWNMPPFFSVILWLCVTGVLAAAAGVLFKRRKTEIAGFWGSSKVMTFIISLDAGLSAFCIGVSSVKNERVASIITGLLAAAAVFLIADILLTFSKREWVKNLRMLPVQTVILAAVGTIFATGLFGYSSRMPELNGVKEIAITPVMYSGIMNVSNDNLFVEGYGEYPSYGYYDEWNSSLSLSTENDKLLAAEIHRMFIEADLIEPDNTDKEAPRSEQILYSPVTIEYTKENGSKLKRHYNYVPMSVFKAYEELNFGDWYKNAVKKQMTEPVSTKDSEQVKMGKSFFQNEDNAVYMASKYLDESYSLLRMTAEQRKQLLNAVANDLINTAADVKQKPLTEQTATLVFTRDSIKTMDAEEEAVYESDYYETDGDYYDYKYNISPYYYKTATAPNQPVPGGGVSRYFSDSTMMSVMITDKMQETIAFLMNNGFSELLSFDVDIVSARVLSRSGQAKPNGDAWYYLGGGYPPSIQFYGMFTYDRVAEYFPDSKVITDASAIEKLQKCSYGSYYTDEEVYYVCFEHSGGGYSIMCIPAKLMPKELAP